MKNGPHDSSEPKNPAFLFISSRFLIPHPLDAEGAGVGGAAWHRASNTPDVFTPAQGSPSPTAPRLETFFLRISDPPNFRGGGSVIGTIVVARLGARLSCQSFFLTGEVQNEFLERKRVRILQCYFKSPRGLSCSVKDR